MLSKNLQAWGLGSREHEIQRMTRNPRKERTMNEIEKFTKEAEKGERDLANLKTDRTKLEAEQGRLNFDEGEALKRCVPEDVDKASAPFEKKLREVRLKLKRNENLIQDAKAAVEKAEEALKAAKAEREERWKIFLAEETQKDSEFLFKSVAAILDEAIDHLIKGQVLLGKGAIIESGLRQRDDGRASSLF